jgi:cell division protein FtsI/penicillin-binding protein 2
VLALAAVAFAIGAIVGGQHSSSPQETLAAGFVSAWAHGDYAKMYGDLDARTRSSTSASEFTDAYQRALVLATATRVQTAGRARRAADDMVTVPVRVQTRLFGHLALSFSLHVVEEGEGARVAWTPSMSFPGLRAGERLERRTFMPHRATLLARDGSVLAEGGGEGTRSSPLGTYADAVLGTVGPPPASRRTALEAEGVPAEASVGDSGLELAMDSRLRGTPGGELLAAGPDGRRVLASVTARPAPPLHTTISPAVQREAVTALGGQLGGIVVMAPASGQILAVAGLGLDGLQPPGSTFKMVTLTGVLQAHLASPHRVFPYASYSTLDGVRLNNANGENCGGSLELAFAVSCNSVFAPLGVKLGAPRLVATAEAYGFNHPTGVQGAPESTLPQASAIQGELELGSTAIGQGQVLATPLQMALVAATIADGGERPQSTFAADSSAPAAPAVSASVSRTVRRLMIGVVRGGTGTAAAIPGVTVAGKTGTAELKTVQPCGSGAQEAAGEAKESSSESCQGGEAQASNTDAWFAAFAPASKPRVALCVMLVKDGAGGETAAPLARTVMEAALRAVR